MKAEMTREEFLKPYKRGYCKVSMDEWLWIAHDYQRLTPGLMMSPGAVAAQCGVTRTAVLNAARRGKIWYFVADKNLWQRGYVLVADCGLEEAFGHRGRPKKAKVA